MTNLRTNLPLRDAFSPVQNCRARYDDWATTLTQSEQEIDQLLNLLAELPDENYRSLRHHTVEYALGLNQIKNRIHRLRIDVLCAGTSCAASAGSASCSDAHFTPPATSNTLMATVATEFNLMKEHCQAFFGELMRLNLI